MPANSIIGGVFAALIISIAATVVLSAPSSMEIEASLSGYNLLWPSQRCCAFKLHLQDGNAIVIADIRENGNAGVYKHKFAVTHDRANRIRNLLEEIDYFRIPELCCDAVDADQRKLRVRLGTQTRSITIPEAIAIDAPLANRQQLEKLKRLWTLVTEGAEAPGATIK